MSCKARQTSFLQLGKIDKIENQLLNYGPWNRDNFHYNNVRNILLNVPFKK
jgi:hypothetical protein